MTESEGAAGTAGQPAAAAFAALLRLYRRRALLTQEDLARRSGVSVRTIRKLENGSGRPRYSSVRLLAGALDLTDQEYEGMTGVFGGLDSVRDPQSAPVIPAQLPPEVTSFVGRSDELARLDAILCWDRPEGTALTNVSGAAGVGKTALALHWAHRSSCQFPDGQLYASLQGFGSSESKPADPALVLAHCMLGQFGSAIAHLEETIPLLRAAGQRAGLASALYSLGAVQKLLWRHPEAHESYRESLVLFRGLNDKTNEALLLCSLGSLMTTTGEAPQAEAYLQESLKISVQTAHRLGETYAHVHLGELYTRTGDRRAAREHLTTALSLSLQAADRFGQAASLRGLGELARREGSRGRDEPADQGAHPLS